ncbi:unnamed protein product [Boreogadus saida]
MVPGPPPHTNRGYHGNVCVALVLLLVQLCCVQVATPCNILRCNSDFVAATFDLGSSGLGGGPAGPSGGAGPGRGAVNAGYCGALRSYASCTARTARSCRGDLTYHAAAQGIQDLLEQHACPGAGPTARPRPPPPPAPRPPAGDACVYEEGFLERGGRAPRYVHCGVFGDPHVRTFGDDFQSCAVRGAWPAIDNEYLYVQVTSSPVRGGANGRYTALTKVTVILKSWAPCTEQLLYTAELDNVPAAFADGSVSGGRGGRGGRGPLISSTDPGRHAAIHAAHIGTLLVVRQSGRSLGLSRLQAAAAAAAAHCSALLPVRDVYQQACVADLLASGELNASRAAVEALADARGMLGGGARLHLPPPRPAAATPPPVPAKAGPLVGVALVRLGLLVLGVRAVL